MGVLLKPPTLAALCCPHSQCPHCCHVAVGAPPLSHKQLVAAQELLSKDREGEFYDTAPAGSPSQALSVCAMGVVLHAFRTSIDEMKTTPFQVESRGRWRGGKPDDISVVLGLAIPGDLTASPFSAPSKL